MSIPKPSPEVLDVIADLYARTGTWCETSKRIYLGPAPDAPAVKHSATAPGRHPEWLVKRCADARRDYLAGRYTPKSKPFATVEEAHGA